MSTKITPRRVTRRDAHEAVAEREPFRYNRSARGEWTDNVTVGELNRTESGQLLKHLNKGLSVGAQSYVIFSYDTPIAAWNLQNGWWTTDRHFSATTTTHQGFVRRGM